MLLVCNLNPLEAQGTWISESEAGLLYLPSSLLKEGRREEKGKEEIVQELILIFLK